MDRVIEITNVPIEIEMKVTPARLEYTKGTAELEISRDRGGLRIKSRPIRLNVDTFEARNSIVPSAATSIKQNAVKGRQASYDATAAYAQQGQLLLKARIGEEMVTKFAAESMAKDVRMNVGINFIPTAPANINWDPGEMSIKFEMDKLNFDWRMERPQFEFIPGDIEFTVTQEPDVIIKYVGGPVYVPKSADPDYEPPES